MITLDIIRDIMQAVETYAGPMDMKSLLAALPYPPEVSSQVIEFLQEVRNKGQLVIEQPAVPQPPMVVIDDAPLNLMDELTYNYKVAKAVLETSLIAGRTVDAEETRKSLRTVSAFMEQALKLQERLYNAQQLQKFQDAVLDTIGSLDTKVRDQVLEKMLEANI